MKMFNEPKKIRQNDFLVLLRNTSIVNIQQPYNKSSRRTYMKEEIVFNSKKIVCCNNRNPSEITSKCLTNETSGVSATGESVESDMDRCMCRCDDET